MGCRIAGLNPKPGTDPGFTVLGLNPGPYPLVSGFHTQGIILRARASFALASFLTRSRLPGSIWMVVKIMVPFWIPIIIRHLIFRVPKKGP